MNGKKRSPPGIKVKYPFDSVPEEWGCTFETWKIFEFNKNFSSQHLTFLLYNTSQKPNLMFSLFWEKKKNFNFLMRIVFIYMLYSHQMLLHIRDEENKTLYIFHSLSLSLQCCCVISIEIFLLRNATAFIVNTKFLHFQVELLFSYLCFEWQFGLLNHVVFSRISTQILQRMPKSRFWTDLVSYTNQKTCTTTAKGYTQQVIGMSNPSCRAILLLLLACELRDTYYLYPSSDNRFIHTHTHTIRMQKKSRNGRDSSTALTFNYVGWNTQYQHTHIRIRYLLSFQVNR